LDGDIVGTGSVFGNYAL